MGVRIVVDVHPALEPVAEKVEAHVKALFEWDNSNLKQAMMKLAGEIPDLKDKLDDIKSK